ncbi:GtrA family protein [Erwinia tasmaniensis]|uniref:GtrA family protein n=1 Tax=Erwinia tasmaniensis TaxID=338565 RepID=UPI003A4D9B47
MKTFKEVVLFGIVGTLGFIIDAGVLYFLKSIVGLYVGRVVSFICAVIITWFFNRNFTFKEVKSKRNPVVELLNYASLMLIGGFFNIGVYYIMIHQSVLVKNIPLIGVAVGSIVGMFVNFISSRLMFYSQKK